MTETCASSASPAESAPDTPSDVFRLALWGGLAYGLVEALVVVALGLVPGGLAWNTGNSVQILWFSPLFYGVVGVALALVFAGLAAAFRGKPWDVVLVAFMTIGGAYLCGSIPPAVIARWAVVVLALGIGVQCTRVYWARRVAAARLMLRSLPWVAASVPVLCGAVFAWGSLAERSAMSSLAAVDASRPNVLLVVMDTQRADHLSTYGYRRETTPRLDAFAREGTLYEWAFANSSWTLPSIASMLTGRLPQVHGAGVIRHPYLDGRLPTLAEELRRRGYATGGFVANGWWCGRQTGLHRGFIRFEDFYGSLGDAVARTELGRVFANKIRPWFGAREVLGRKRVGDVNDGFLRWLDEIGDRRFFAFVNYTDVHAPYLPPEPFRGTYSSGTAVMPNEHEINIGALEGDMPELQEEQLVAMRDAYDESLLSLDAGMGDLFDELRRRGVLDDTVVIVTADHGESFGEHAMIWHGHSLHVEQVRAPLIVRYPPAVPADVRSAAPVGLDRLAATICALTGADDAPFGDAGLPGIAGAPDATDEPVIAGVARRSSVPGGWPTSRASVTAIATRRWLLALEDGTPSELFDLENDPAGLTNLVDDPERAAEIEALRAHDPGGW